MSFKTGSLLCRWSAKRGFTVSVLTNTKYREPILHIRIMYLNLVTNKLRIHLSSESKCVQLIYIFIRQCAKIVVDIKSWLNSGTLHMV